MRMARGMRESDSRKPGMAGRKLDLRGWRGIFDSIQPVQLVLSTRDLHLGGIPISSHGLTPNTCGSGTSSKRRIQAMGGGWCARRPRSPSPAPVPGAGVGAGAGAGADAGDLVVAVLDSVNRPSAGVRVTMAAGAAGEDGDGLTMASLVDECRRTRAQPAAYAVRIVWDGVGLVD